MIDAVVAWKERVDSHHAQSIRVQDLAGWPTDDSWGSISSLFMADPYRSDDPILDRVGEEVCSDYSVLDVGGGAGRYALPLALKCSHVTVVEPSPSMAEALLLEAKKAGIDNLSVVQAHWEEAQVDTADVVLCAHVLDGTSVVGPFLHKLEQHARKRVLILNSMESPQALFSPIWAYVHQEQRQNLPGLPELLAVLWDMGIYPDVEMLEPLKPETAPTKEAALSILRQMLYVRPNADEDWRLFKAIELLVSETPQGFGIKDAAPRREGLISWRPASK